MATLQQTVERWKNSASGAQTRYTEGVQGTQVDVVQRAVAAKGKLIANFAASVNNGTWERKLAAVGTAGWKAATVAKASNYSTGIAAGESKFQAAMQVWLPRTQAIAAQVHAMPNNGIADSVNRARAFMEAMHAAKMQG